MFHDRWTSGIPGCMPLILGLPVRFTGEPERGDRLKGVFTNARGWPRGWQLTNEEEQRLQATNIPKACENLEKIDLRPSKIEARGLQNRTRSPPRRNFKKMLNLRGSKWATPEVFWCQNGQLGSNLEAQEAPKSRPKP